MIIQFLLYTMGDDTVTSPPQSPEKMAEIEKFMGELVEAGVLRAGGGLAPSAQGVKVRLSDVELTVMDGPFAEAKELVGGWALVEVDSLEEAIELTKRFRKLEGEGESVIRQVFA